VAIDLKATLTLVDKLSAPMKNATKSVEKFRKEVRSAAKEMGTLAAAQRAMNPSNVVRASREAVNANNRMSQSYKNVGQSAKRSAQETTRAMESATRRIEALERQSAASAARYANQRETESHRADERIREDAVRHANRMAEIQAQANESALRAQRAHDNAMELENRRMERLQREHQQNLAEIQRRSDLADQAYRQRQADRAVRDAQRQAQRELDARNRVMRGTVNGVVGGAASSVSSFASTAMAPLGYAALGAGYGAGRIGVSSLSNAMDFEQLIANIRSVSEPKDKDKFKMGTAFEQKLLDIASKTIYSPTEVAQAGFVQSKAGVSYNDMMGGALKTSLDLAQAVDWIPEESANLMVQAKGAFKQFDKMNQGDAYKHIANTIAGAANYSILDPQDFKSMIAMGAGVSSKMGMTFDDLVAFGTMMNKGAGLVGGSDIGTSIKTFSQMITNPTGPAKKMMMKVGWMDKKGHNMFYDDKGNIKSLEQMGALVYKTTKNMNNEQRGQLFDAVGGADAARAIGGLYEVGKDKKRMKDLRNAMKFADVSEISEDRLNTASAKLKMLKNAWDTISIVFFSELLPLLGNTFAKVKDWMLDKNSIKKIAAEGKKFADGFKGFVKDVMEPVQNASGKLKWKDMNIGEKIGKVLTTGLDKAINWIQSDNPLATEIRTKLFDALEGYFEFLIKALGAAIKTVVPMALASVVEKFKKGDWLGGGIETAISGAVVNMLTFGLVTKLGGAVTRGAGAWIRANSGTPPVPPGGTPPVPPGGGPIPPVPPGGGGTSAHWIVKTASFLVQAATITYAAQSLFKTVDNGDKIQQDMTNGFASRSEFIAKNGYVKDRGNSWLDNASEKGDLRRYQSGYNTLRNGGKISKLQSMDGITENVQKLIQQRIDLEDRVIGEEIDLMKLHGQKISKDVITNLHKQYENTMSMDTLKTQDDKLSGQIQQWQQELMATSSSELSKSLQADAQTVKSAIVQLFGSLMQGNPIIPDTTPVVGALNARDLGIVSTASNALAGAISGAPMPVFNFFGAITGLVSRVADAAQTAFNNAVGGQKTTSKAPPKAAAPKKAGGEWRVPGDGLRYVHKDETILPRGEANAYRSGKMGSSGGGHIIITGNNFSVRSDDDIDAIAKALAYEINKAKGLVGNE
jgi:TP901 family phage tail tape measure protein